MGLGPHDGLQTRYIHEWGPIWKLALSHSPLLSHTLTAPLLFFRLFVNCLKSSDTFTWTLPINRITPILCPLEIYYRNPPKIIIIIIKRILKNIYISFVRVSLTKGSWFSLSTVYLACDTNTLPCLFTLTALLVYLSLGVFVCVEI